jgi:hypothetical protein
MLSFIMRVTVVQRRECQGSVCLGTGRHEGHPRGEWGECIRTGRARRDFLHKAFYEMLIINVRVQHSAWRQRETTVHAA